METGTSIFISVAAVACVGAGLYYLYKKQKVTAPLKIERVDSLRMEDVVAWFRSLNMDAAKHTPFICNNLSLFDLKFDQQMATPNILLGVYDEQKNSLSPYRFLDVKTIDSSIKSLFDRSQNGLVVLS